MFKYALRMSSNSVYRDLLRDKNGKVSTGGHMAAGAMSGVTEALMVVTPFDVIKIRLQQQRGTAAVGTALAAAAGAGGLEAVRYKGPMHCAAVTLREEGLRGLWSGALPTVMRNGTTQMCLFASKPFVDQALWDKVEGDGKQLSAGQSLISGFLAASLGPFVTGPLDVIKTRLMAQTKQQQKQQQLQQQGGGAGVVVAVGGMPRYTGFLDALVKIPREEGIRALWKGNLPRLLRIPSGQAMVWMVTDQVTGYYEKTAAAATA